MEKQRTKTSSWKKLVLVFAAAMIFLLPVKAVYANSLPPPSVVWFSFVYQTTQTPRLLGVQLIACRTTNCEQPVLLQQYGTCDGAGCVTSPPKLAEWPSDFECAANVCRSATSVGYMETGFKLVVQFSDRVRASEVMEKLPLLYGEVSTWRVLVRDTDLSIEGAPPPAVSDPARSFPKQPLLQFGLSILVELLVAGVCFWRTVEPRYLEGKLLIVLLVNLVSLPVVWFFFPALGQFQSSANLTIGFIVLLAAFIYAALLAGIYRSENKTRRWVVALTALSLPVTAFCSLVVFSFLNGYYGRNITVQGLPASVTIFASEVFAVVFEAILITILSKKSLPLRVIWITSLLMNAASFGVGLLLNNIR
jgi:hypothetical protein